MNSGLRRINLNLLMNLDALLRLKNVSKAAESLHITQSAMSNALNQLRTILDDPILVRHGSQMLPTEKAIALAPQVSTLIDQMEGVFTQKPTFDPAISERIFTIGMSDHAEFAILPRLLRTVSTAAPGIEIRVEHYNNLMNIDPLLQGQIDVVLGSVFPQMSCLYREVLYPLRAIVLARSDHPLMQQKLTLKRYLSAKHLRIAYQSQPELTFIDKELGALGHQRAVQVTIPHVLPALFMLQNTDLLASMPDFLSPELRKSLKLSAQPLPFSLPDIQLSQLWHKIKANDPAQIWLRTQIKNAAQTCLQQ